MRIQIKHAHTDKFGMLSFLSTQTSTPNFVVLMHLLGLIPTTVELSSTIACLLNS